MALPISFGALWGMAGTRTRTLFLSLGLTKIKPVCQMT